MKERRSDKNEIIYSIPIEANLYNACNEPCDMIGFPCVCGSWHEVDYFDRRTTSQDGTQE